MKLDLHYFFEPKHAKWIISIFVCMFSLLILIKLIWLIRLPSRLADLPKEIKPITQTKPDTTNYFLQSTLFGIYVPPDLSEAGVKKSMLDVTIVGILFAVPIEGSQVIIKASDGDEKTYLLGDTLPGGAVIKRITASGVLVERNGVLESLSLPKEDLTFEPIPKPLKDE